MPVLKTLMVWDTETTGLVLHPGAELNKQPRIIEFACAFISCVDGELLQTHSHLINPQRPLPAEITKITGLKDEDVASQPTFEQVLPKLRGLFKAAYAMLAHNLPFDKAMLSNDLARHDVTDFPWPRVELCTVGLYSGEWGRDMRLKELYQHATGKPLAQTHRALDDVMALVEIVQAQRIWSVV